MSTLRLISANNDLGTQVDYTCRPSQCYRNSLLRGIPYLSPLVAGFSLRMLGLNPTPVHAGFVMGEKSGTRTSFSPSTVELFYNVTKGTEYSESL